MLIVWLMKMQCDMCNVSQMEPLNVCNIEQASPKARDFECSLCKDDIMTLNY